MSPEIPFSSNESKKKRYFYSTISMKLKDSKCGLPRKPRNTCCSLNAIYMYFVCSCRAENT